MSQKIKLLAKWAAKFPEKMSYHCQENKITVVSVYQKDAQMIFALIILNYASNNKNPTKISELWGQIVF